MSRLAGYLKTAIIMAILLVLLLNSQVALGGHLQAKDLAKEGDEDSVTGDPIYVTFTFTYSGATATIRVYVPKGDAYLATAAIVWGLYDHNKDKFISFSSDKASRSRNHDGLLCDYIYVFQGLYDSGLVQYKRSDGWLKVYRHYDEWGYFKKTGLLCIDERIYVYTHVWPQATIAPGRY
ncbi:MAG: hypothetical protein LRS43_01875 [Desulfurococcales archaeon]|nr:hypothetical protein [Desulfurococcales archaeon]